MNAISFATMIDAAVSHVLAGKAEHISLHMTIAPNRFGVVVFDSTTQEMHQLPVLATRADADKAMWSLRDAFYA